MNRTAYLVILCILFSLRTIGQGLKINEQGYFEKPGLNITVFSDIYPDGHQTGVTIIQHGNRVAANGDLRLEASPGQWSPVPKGGHIKIDEDNQRITQRLWYPDSSKNRTGFNPILYPDLTFAYEVEVKALEGNSFQVAVHLDEALPEEWIGKVHFNFELFPGDLFGKSWLMDQQTGQFPIQPNGPIIEQNDTNISLPMAKGQRLTVAPESDLQRIRFQSQSGILQLRDGRSNHNNGWFIINEAVPSGTTQNAIVWIITPNTVEDWVYQPVIQVSQLGYHPDQEKRAVIELDKRSTAPQTARLYRIGQEGKSLVKEVNPENWGEFLRYQYRIFDFSEIKEAGLYTVQFGAQETHAFQISKELYDRNIWQPVLEYYLPVQMCHMRVNEKYRVWHDYCHLDDARMAPVNTNHFDGYIQETSTLTEYKSGEIVPALNQGGWHDAGDYDLRVESQIGTIRNLAWMIEEFGINYDATMVDPYNQLVEIHQPDGKSDALQQIEHGLHSVLAGYRSLGRLYRGIICPTLRQYVMLGDASAMTDNLFYDPALAKGDRTARNSSLSDDRWVFTEENPRRELHVISGLAAASRVLAGYNDDLATESLVAAEALYDLIPDDTSLATAKSIALSELILSTGKRKYIDELLTLQPQIVKNIEKCGWAIGRVMDQANDRKFRKAIDGAVQTYHNQLKTAQKADSPYGVPYTPNIWGAGWSIQRFGVEQYFFYKGWPEICTPDFTLNSLNFVLGVHPGINTSSFASGVGSKSVTVAYGVNRADWSFIPGGVASGTALIRPDLPELKVWPFFWQQTEYVMGGGSTDYMFLVLAVQDILKN
ncbi:N-terminal ig-like domain of cellulase [Reichenbachiella agariperforans]|uniref:N-terminal ig-like domain of cellulase n=1 Tax=Reichenbachiella agariperforans TaxID=156994 RepID=A0A1M6V286_REIAG|nr:glycoside hydrolase family 9 protein [Reichenbachiella agariperforans]SHK75511.1 N-terminal ig-like domain of cellulase [Reichenbachiella agariperforans]